MSLRSFLIFIRKQRAKNVDRLFLFSFGVILLSIILAVLVDIFLPFNNLWFNFLRAFITIPIAVSVFVTGYTFSLTRYEVLKSNNDDWVPYRLRFSPSWRRKISAVIASFLILIIYALNQSQNVFYTSFSGVVFAVVIALFAFMRLTRKEEHREELGIPDARDIQYRKKSKELARKRELEEEEALKKKSAEKYKKWGIKDKHYDDLDD